MTEPFLWWRDGIIYQIYPRSFADTDSDGLGDIPGITARLDYLADLGVDAIWLSPIYPSPDVDFGYDVSDYTAIDPRFGSLDDFDRMVQEAHQRGIRIVLDLVLNHTSDQHPWFKASRSSRDNPYRDWYLWVAPKPGGGRPNNWQSIFGGPGWEFDPETGEYYFHMFAKEQPDLNWRNPAVRQAVLDVVRFWLDHGTDGFRLDVFNVYFKHADLLDNPFAIGLRGFDRQRHIYDIDQPEMMPFLAELRSLLDSCPERYMVGETFTGGYQNAVRYTGADRLHAAFNFSFTQTRWNPAKFLREIQSWDRALGKDNWPNYVLSNHDLPRAATRFAKDGNDERLKVAAVLMLTLRGTPFLYYGEEIGMRDISLRRDQILDPPGKRYWPFFKGRDGCRSPMQWDPGPNAGFTTGQPWLPVHPGYPSRNVANQQKDPGSLLNFYRALIRLRRSHSALTRGDFRPLPMGSAPVLAYVRSVPGQSILVALNFSAQAQTIHIDKEANRPDWEMYLSSRQDSPASLQAGCLTLGPDEACLLGNRM